MSIEERQEAPVAETVVASRNSRSGLLIDLALPVLLAVVASLATGYFVEKRVEDNLEQRLGEERPYQAGVAVVDDIGLIRLAIDRGADRFNTKSVSDEITRIVQEAGLEGTVLISPSQVLYAPPEAMIDVAQPAPRPEPSRPVLGGASQ